MKARILLSNSAEDDSPAYYCAAVLAAGGEPSSFYCPEVSTQYEGLILCGGEDLDPLLFGQENCGSTGIDPKRDKCELALAEAFLKAGKPILGICRGHQVLNVALGGSLVQNIAPNLQLFHTPEDDMTEKVHPVRAAEGSVLFDLYGACFPVNSWHHQALDRLGTGLRPVQWSEGELVEGVEHESLPVLAVQFHPERMTGEKLRPDTVDGGAIFRWFMRKCVELSHAQ